MNENELNNIIPNILNEEEELLRENQRKQEIEEKEKILFNDLNVVIKCKNNENLKFSPLGLAHEIKEKCFLVNFQIAGFFPQNIQDWVKYYCTQCKEM